MSRHEEFVGVRVIKIADYDGEGSNLYSMWLRSDEPIVRCRDCKNSYDSGIRCNRIKEEKINAITLEVFTEDAYVRPNGFCKWGAERDD